MTNTINTLLVNYDYIIAILLHYLHFRCLGFVCSMALGEEEIDPTLKYIATEDYTTDDPRQISFTMGTTLIVVEKSEDGESWYGDGSHIL